MIRERLDVTLILTAASVLLLSIALWFTDNRDEGVFVGLWVPSILAAGGSGWPGEDAMTSLDVLLAVAGLAATALVVAGDIS